MEITTVQQMKDLDKQAISQWAIKDEILMENAGLAAVTVMDQECGIEGKRFLIICGGGNNGGDGLVVARKIHSMHGEAVILFMADPGKYKGPALANYRSIEKLPIKGNTYSPALLKKELQACDVVVDAMFGTGLMRPVEGVYKQAIDLVNRQARPVFSLDIPSGINGNSGLVMGTAVRADVTITFGLPKVGNLFYPGFEYNGKLFLTHISFPQTFSSNQDPGLKTNTPAPLPPRKKDGHKGEFGACLFVAGAANYYGAPCFAAMSFLKGGGGYARLAAPASITPVIAAKGSEIVFHPLTETPTGSLDWDSRHKIIDLANQCDLVVIGPGLSLADETQRLVRFLAANLRKPILVDGDGLTALAGHLEILKKRKNHTILTPHLGEMSVLTGKGVEELKQDMVTLLPALCRDLQANVVVKGAHSLIGTANGKLHLNLSGNSGMATAGSGDVLCGTIAAMYGLGLTVADAARTGVFIHGLAGDLAAEEIGEDGMTAGDILAALPRALKQYRQRYHELTDHHYNRIHRVP